MYITVHKLNIIITFHNRIQRGRGREERWRRRDTGEETAEETQGKRQRGETDKSRIGRDRGGTIREEEAEKRDVGEDTKVKRQRGKT